MSRRPRILAVACVVVVLATAGCGVSTSGPVDLGDGLVAGANNRNAGDRPPSPNDATSEVDLVQRYLKAGVESGPDQPLDRVQAFLTSKAQDALGVDPKNPPDPMVIRIVGGPTRSLADPGGTNVQVDYIQLGPLSDQGRIDDLADPTVKAMTFHVTPGQDPSKLRIDKITNAPAPIVISDDALNQFYRVQPIYFWDSSNTTLVPDIRYIPVGLAADARAGRIVQWLVDGPSGWVGAARLPTGIAVKPSVQVRDSKVVVNLNAQAAAVGDAALERLYHQLQWSLRESLATTQVTLEIEDKAQVFKGSPTDYQRFDASYLLPARGVKYDIVDGKVVPIAPGGTTPLPILAAKENQNVLYAAINRTATAAAYVKLGSDGRNKSLLIVRDGAPTVTVTFQAKSPDVGRPVWATGDTLLIPYGGLLYAVTVADGHATNVTPQRVGKVQAVSMAPDGRRLALVADGQAYVTSFTPGDSLSVGNTPRALLTGQVTALAVAWTDERSLYVAGKSTTMWQVTADGVIATNLSKALGGVTAIDVVAFPTAPFQGSAEAFLYTPAIYPFFIELSQLTLDPKLKAPFFGG